jgi:hypothetical protein
MKTANNERLRNMMGHQSLTRLDLKKPGQVSYGLTAFFTSGWEITASAEFAEL